MRLILASTSPRRKDLLTLLQIPFEQVEPVFVEEITPGLPPRELAMTFARKKATSCPAHRSDVIVLGSDTLIAIDTTIMGKPSDLSDAARMLNALRGRVHFVHTAVALYREGDGRVEVGVESVRVHMRNFSSAELSTYLQSGESWGKAGAYSIQGLGGDLVEQIDGDFPTVVGLPLRLVSTMLSDMGIVSPVEIRALYRAMPFPNWKRFCPQP